jgi:hypothetical protein
MAAASALAPVLPRGIREQFAFLIFALLAVTVLVPHVSIGSVAIGADDVLALPVLLWLAVRLLQARNVRLAPATLALGFLWLTIVVHGCLMGMAATVEYFGRPSFPTEMWQYFKRIAFFYAAFVIAATRDDDVAPAYTTLVAVLLAATLIGVLQIGSGPLSQALSSWYARTDAQLEHLVDRALATRRIYGVAGNSGAWGGFCVFVAATALPFVLVRDQAHRGRRGWRVLVTLLLILALVNVLFSASRGPLAAFVVVLLVKGFLEVTIRGGGLPVLIKWLAWATTIAGVAFYFALDRVALLGYRLLTLVEQGGGERVDQVSAVLFLLDSPATFLNGVGNAVQRAYGVSHGVEVEPVYLLVNYGLIGTAARYGLWVILAYCALAAIRSRDLWTASTGMATVLALSGYCVFSLGYFFFQELYVGVLPWLLFGLAAGVHQRLWLERQARAKHSAGVRTGLAADGAG